jgi:multidrug efflux pump
MGVVIAAGLSIGTCFTLFVVPAVYLVLATNKNPRPVAPPAPSLRAAAE